VPWAITWGVIGYLLGNNWPLLMTVMKTVGYGGVAVLVAVVVIFLVVRRRVSRP
jgi:membrane protein DedA with SNARE-associated domain